MRKWMLLALLVMVPSMTMASSPPVDLTTGWEYRWGDSPLDATGVPTWSYEVSSDWLAVPGRTYGPPGERENFLWLRIRLPQGEWLQAAVHFASVFEAGEIFLSGRRLTRVGEMAPSELNRFNYMNWHTALLPPDFSGQYLYFRLFSEKPQIGLSPRLRVGTQDDLIRAILQHHGDTFVFGSLFIVVGLFALFLAFKRRAANLSLYLSFGGFVLCTGIFFVCINSVSQLALSSLPLRYYLGYTAFLILPVGLFAFYEQIIDERYRRLFRWIWRLHAFLAVIGLFLELAGVVPLLYSRFVVIGLLPIDVIILFLVGARVARSGNVEAKIFNLGFAVLGLFGLHDLLLSFGVIPDWHHLFGWGAFALILTLGYILEQRFTENSEALKLSNLQLEKANLTLEERVRERTHDLNEKKEELEQTLSQLQAAQQQLVMQEKMASLGNLVAGVAHEINTPVAAVSSSAETSRLSVQKILEYLENRKEAGTLAFQRAIGVLRKSQDITSEASQRIATIVRGLRHFARLDESERQRADLQEGLEITLALLQHELRDRIQVVKTYGELPRVDCHPDQMNQVFMNLLVNAARAIEDHGTIAITTAAEGDQVSIAISDTGVGIPQEHQHRIFDPGFTTKGVGVGTGLGLATSYRIVKDHGGEIEVESSSGKGTTFTVQLPVDATVGNRA